MSNSRKRGDRAENAVTEAYKLDLAHPSDSENWYDAVNPRTSSKYQVKTAKPERRFRLWSDHHRSLTASEGQNAAWYVFVLLDPDTGHPTEMRRVKPSTVTKWIRDRGGWNRAGHELRPGAKQHKLPVSEVF